MYNIHLSQGNKVGWLDARNLCRERCMDLVSIETFEENMMVMKLVHDKRLKDLWTSGRLCNFKGCDAKHLQPRKINGQVKTFLTIMFNVEEYQFNFCMMNSF